MVEEVADAVGGGEDEPVERGQAADRVVEGREVVEGKDRHGRGDQGFGAEGFEVGGGAVGLGGGAGDDDPLAEEG